MSWRVIYCACVQYINPGEWLWSHALPSLRIWGRPVPKDRTSGAVWGPGPCTAGDAITTISPPAAAQPAPRRRRDVHHGTHRAVYRQRPDRGRVAHDASLPPDVPQQAPYQESRRVERSDASSPLAVPACVLRVSQHGSNRVLPLRTATPWGPIRPRSRLGDEPLRLSSAAHCHAPRQCGGRAPACGGGLQGAIGGRQPPHRMRCPSVGHRNGPHRI
jgi:hypothetical protein